MIIFIARGVDCKAQKSVCVKSTSIFTREGEDDAKADTVLVAEGMLIHLVQVDDLEGKQLRTRQTVGETIDSSGVP
jgi:hypothetical protein